MNKACIGIGSNHNAEDNLRACLPLLAQQVEVIAVSPVYQSRAAGGGQDYLNAVVVIETELDPVSLKENILVEIETQLGRVRGQPEVSLDLDILLFNSEQYDFGKRQIPDPAIYTQAFVAIPLADVAPDFVHPVGGETLRDIAAKFPLLGGMTVRDDVSLMPPR